MSKLFGIGEELSRTGYRIVLASASPRRSELLGRIVPSDLLVVQPSGFDENLDKSVGPEAYAIATAIGKRDDVISTLCGGNSQPPNAVVVASDTVVVSPDGQILEKPADEAAARAMIASLSGRTHRVVTGVAMGVVASREASSSSPDEDLSMSFATSTKVTFADLATGDIEAYVATGEPMDKAGGYGIQGLAGVFVSGIEGCYYNVVGLPLHAVAEGIHATLARIAATK